MRLRAGAEDDRGVRVDPHLAHQYASNPFLVAKAGPLYYENGYTGTGELRAVAMLVELFTRMGKNATIKSSQNITTSDLQQHTLILLGSPSQNPALDQLPVSGDMRFLIASPRHELWGSQIINAHPFPGKKSYYQTERNPVSGALQADYSMLSVQPSILPGHFIAIMGGLDTTGTEGAAIYATSASGGAYLSGVLGGSNMESSKRYTHGFQALLYVRLEKGSQVLDVNVAAIHPFPDSKSVFGSSASALLSSSH